MEVIFQALGIIFEVQMKMNNEKIIGKNNNLPTYKMCFFFVFCF